MSQEEYIEAQKRVKKIKRFYKSLAQWAGTSIFLVALNIFTDGKISWAIYPVFFWGIAVFYNVFEIIRLQKHDKDWEKRQMEKQLGRPLTTEELTAMEEPRADKHQDAMETEWVHIVECNSSKSDCWLRWPR